MEAQSPARRWFIGVILVTLALFAVTPLLDQRAADNYESLFQRALVTFALARTLNGVISAVQGTEVALQPAGVGVTLTPGEVLDPVNDLVERFSWIMLGATVSLGVQQVLLEVSAWWFIQALVVLLAGWLLFLYFARRESSRHRRRLAWRVFGIALFLRFAVPLTLVANEAVYELFLEERYEQSTEVITSAGEALEEIQREQDAAGEQAEAEVRPGSEGGWLGSLGKAWTSATDTLDIGDRVDRIQARAGELIEQLIQLSVVFILQTGLLPIAFLWVFLQLGKWLLRPLRH
ncbi:MAG: hypothetical protein P8008_05695 [Gammaproteobacteria bacterium]